MRVIEGKQAVLQPYLTETQCVRMVGGQTVHLRTPVEYAPPRENVREIVTKTVQPGKAVSPQEHSTMEAETVSPREQTVPYAVIQPLQTKDLTAADAVMVSSRPALVSKIQATADSGRILQETVKEQLTIETLFTQI